MAFTTAIVNRTKRRPLESIGGGICDAQYPSRACQ
jgi:hypothetical protein